MPRAGKPTITTTILSDLVAYVVGGPHDCGVGLSSWPRRAAGDGGTADMWEEELPVVKSGGDDRRRQQARAAGRRQDWPWVEAEADERTST